MKKWARYIVYVVALIVPFGFVALALYESYRLYKRRGKNEQTSKPE